MSYSVAVCDDSPADASYVAGLLELWARERNISVQIDHFPSAEAFLFCYVEKKSYDLLLLDIEMGAMDGVTLARHIRRDNESIQILFLTGYSDYIAEGYEVAALHYLLKPVDKQKLFSVLDRAVEKKKHNERCLNLDLSGEMIRIPLCEIRCLEVRQNYVTIHAGKDYTVKRPLKDFEHSLDSRFCRAGRSLILNVTFIRRITKTEVRLSDGSVFPIPRGAYEPLNRAIITYT